MEKPIIWRIVFPVLLFIAGCDTSTQYNYNYQVPESANDGWQVAALDKEDLSLDKVSEMMDYLEETPGHNLHCILFFRNGKLIFEEYFDGYLYSSNPPGSNGDFITYTKETDHYLASVSKSITSVIFGAAVKQGYIENLDARVVDVLPEYAGILTGDKADLTLEHLLTMSSGLSWDESSTSYEDPNNDVVQLFMSEDPIEYILSLPLIDPPGTQFLYNSGATNVLGAVIQEATGMSLLDFGNECLFDPLQMEGGLWQRLPGDNFFASGGIFLRPRELAKIGFLFLNDGYWGDQQIITESWIAESVEEHIPTHGRTLPLAHAYGYQWWLQDYEVDGQTFPTFLAAGWGDQYMIMFPEEDLIILFNGGNYLSSGTVSPFYLVEHYIIPALSPS